MSHFDSRLVRSAIILLALSPVAIIFQNCGQGFKAVEPAGLASQASSAVTPQIAFLNAAPPSFTNQTAITFSFGADLNAADQSINSGLTFTCHLDSAVATSCASPMVITASTEGSHTFYVQARNAQGGQSQIAQSWTTDVSAPQVTITTPPPSITAATSVNILFSATDKLSGIASTECAFDTATFTPCTSPFMKSGLTSAPHTLNIRATDKAGNVSTTQTTAWTVDSTVPTVAIAPQFTSPTKIVTPGFTFTATDNGQSLTSGFQCQMDGGAFSSCKSPYTSVALPQGNHTFGVKVTNSGGTTSSVATVSFLIDTTAPTVAINSAPSNCTAGSCTNTVTFTASDTLSGIATTTCSVNGSAAAACVSPYTIVNGLTASGPQTIMVNATDKAGNVASANATWTISAAVMPRQVGVTPASATPSLVYTTNSGYSVISEPRDFLIVDSSNSIVGRVAPLPGESPNWGGYYGFGGLLTEDGQYLVYLTSHSVISVNVATGARAVLYDGASNPNITPALVGADSKTDRIVFQLSSSSGATGTGSFVSILPDGTGLVNIGSSSAKSLAFVAYFPSQTKLKIYNDTLVYVDGTTPQLMSAKLDGSQPPQVVQPPNTSFQYPSGAPTGLDAVENDHFFFIDANSCNGSGNCYFYVIDLSSPTLSTQKITAPLNANSYFFSTDLSYESSSTSQGLVIVTGFRPNIGVPTSWQIEYADPNASTFSTVYQTTNGIGSLVTDNYGTVYWSETNSATGQVNCLYSKLSTSLQPHACPTGITLNGLPSNSLASGEFLINYPSLGVINFNTGNTTTLVPTRSNGTWVSDGTYIYFNAGANTNVAPVDRWKLDGTGNVETVPGEDPSCLLDTNFQSFKTVKTSILLDCAYGPASYDAINGFRYNNWPRELFPASIPYNWTLSVINDSLLQYSDAPNVSLPQKKLADLSQSSAPAVSLTGLIGTAIDQVIGAGSGFYLLTWPSNGVTSTMYNLTLNPLAAAQPISLTGSPTFTTTFNGVSYLLVDEQDSATSPRNLVLINSQTNTKTTVYSDATPYSYVTVENPVAGQIIVQENKQSSTGVIYQLIVIDLNTLTSRVLALPNLSNLQSTYAFTITGGAIRQLVTGSDAQGNPAAVITDANFNVLETLPNHLSDGTSFKYMAGNYYSSCPVYFDSTHNQIYFCGDEKTTATTDSYFVGSVSLSSGSSTVQVTAKNVLLDAPVILQSGFAPTVNGFYYSTNSSDANPGVYYYNTQSLSSTPVLSRPVRYSTRTAANSNGFVVMTGPTAGANGSVATDSLYFVDANSTSPVASQISNAGENVLDYIYDPITNRVLFTSTLGDWSTLNLYVYNIATKQRAPVISPSAGFYIGDFVWGPNGKSAIFTYSDENTNMTGTLEVPLTN